MDKNFFSIVTNVGKNEMMAAVADTRKLNITEFAVGDGGGEYYTPEPEQTELRNEVWRGTVNSGYTSTEEENLLIIDSVIPYDVGGFTIREMAIYDDKGNMIAVCNTPDTQKVKVSDGAVHELDLSMEIAMDNAENVELVINPNVAVATKRDLEVIEKEIRGQYATKDEVDDLKKSVSDGKSAIASAITDMGVSTESDATFSTISDNIKKIKAKLLRTANIIKAVVNGKNEVSLEIPKTEIEKSGSWSGATYTARIAHTDGYIDEGEETHIVTIGTMSSGIVTPGTSSKTIIGGGARIYLSGNLNVDSVGGNAYASDVLSGKTFSSNNAGRAVSGTMKNIGAYTYDIFCVSKNGSSDYSGLNIAIPSGYHNGSGYIRAHASSHFCFCKTHCPGEYYSTGFYASAGNYYGIGQVSEINTDMLFVVLWNGSYTNVLDIMFIGNDWENRRTSYTGDFAAWKQWDNVYVGKDYSKKIADGTYVNAVVLSFVGK